MYRRYYKNDIAKFYGKVCKCHEKYVPLQRLCVPLGLYPRFYSGLTGFDSGTRWYVSMQSNGCELYNHFGQQFNWRKQLRSRCLIEV